MKNFIISYKKTNNLHHAYAIEGEKKSILSELYHFFENELKIQTKANPDFYFNEFESFGIDNGRELANYAFRKSVDGNIRIFVIVISSITIEAQNALLKLFEEPTDGTHFFIIIQSSNIFLPTLRSRFNIISQGLSLETATKNVLVNKFLKSTKSERIKLFENIIKEKNKEEALNFLNDLEAILYKNKTKNTEIFEILQKSRSYLRGRAPSIKMILENISIIDLP